MEINKIYNEDCLEGLKRIPDASIDCILTDPPYLYLKGQKLDRPFDEKTVFSEFKRVIKPAGFIVLFGRGTSFYRWNIRLAELGFEFKEEIIWNKRRVSSAVSSLARVHETISISTIKGKINKSIINYGELNAFSLDKITDHLTKLGTVFNKGEQFEKIVRNLKLKNDTGTYVYGKKKTGSTITCSSKLKERHINTHIVESMFNGLRERSIIDMPGDHYGRIHPTQKPVRLIERLLELTTQPGDIVLDPFAGSCSTAMACINSSRRFVGFEIDEEYYAAGLERVKNALSEPKLAM